jgi:Bacteriocin-protection, YdeI or OmpD-Associated
VNGTPDVPWRINMMPVGDGSFFLYLHGQVRKASDTKVGDVANFTVEFDEEYRGGPGGPTPRWFSAALRRNAAARKGWNALPPSRKKEILRYLVRLKSPEARERNLQKALHVLGGGEARFMARSWSEGR